MKATEFGFVILRVSGLWLAVRSLLGVLQILPILFGDPVPGFESAMLRTGWVTLVNQALLLGVGFYVFRRARGLALHLFGSAEGTVGRTSSADIQAVAFSVVGLYLAVSALPMVVQLAVELFWTLRDGAGLERGQFFSSNRFQIMGRCLELAVGAWLFVRASHLSRYWQSLQADT